MQMIFLRLYFVVVLFTIEVHEVQFIDQAQALQEIKSSIDSRAVNVGIPAPSLGEKGCCVEMGVRFLDGFNQSASLRREANSTSLYLIQQLAPFGHSWAISRHG